MYIIGNILSTISEISVTQLEEEVDHLNYDVINRSCCLCFDLCLPSLSEDDTLTEVESSKCLLSSSPGDGETHYDGENQTHGGGRV